ncbi:MAG: FkbM family methyltransferase [Alphaproteobacteria bacterium]|jgi:FkbM family methyltransferase
MLLHIYRFLARAFRVLPKTRRLKLHGMEATFFVPINNHYICDDLIDIEQKKREPELYRWLHDMEDGAIFFDVGTSYGQESALASSFRDRKVRVFGFDCGLYQSHFCALNRTLNEDRYKFTFAAIAATSGQLITITANSDTHLAALHKKNVPYEYEVMTLALDDFARANAVMPSHIKIDVDGAEVGVLHGAREILASDAIKEVFIEVDQDSMAVFEIMEANGFDVRWKIQKANNVDVLFSRSRRDQAPA